MNPNLSRRELCFIYKAIIRSLIDRNGIKHSWIAAQIGMRDDTFSRWFKNPHKSLSIEEMKLFCEALKISAVTIEQLLDVAISFKKSTSSMADYVSGPANGDAANNLILLFGKNDFVKLMLQINEYLKFDVMQIEYQDLDS